MTTFEETGTPDAEAPAPSDEQITMVALMTELNALRAELREARGMTGVVEPGR